MRCYIKLTFCIGLIGVCLIFNLLLFQAEQLKQPVFLKHYYELGLEESTIFTIGCLMNKDDTRELVQIEFPELTGEGHFFRVSLGNQFNLNAHHDQREYWIEYHYKGEGMPIEEEISLTRAKVMFNNGEEMDIPIGQIIFYPVEHERAILEDGMSQASSSGETSFSGIFTEDVRFDGIKSTLDLLVKDFIEIRINGMPPEPQFFKQGMAWKLEGKMEIDSKDSRRFNYYEIQSRIYFEDLKGEEIIDQVLNLRYTPYFSRIDSYKYLREEGGLDEI